MDGRPPGAGSIGTIPVTCITFRNRRWGNAVLSAVQRDEHYFLMRAEEEEAIAATSQNVAAKDCHLRIAKFYREAAIKRQPRSLGDCELSGPGLPIS